MPGPARCSTRYFQSGAGADIGSGRPNEKLLGLFAPSSMTVAGGATDRDAQAGYRRDMCQFADDRLSAAQKLAFVHALLDRDMAEVRMFLEQIERYAGSLGDAERQEPAVASAHGGDCRRYRGAGALPEFVRDADEPSVRARMIALAARLGWLTPAEKLAELASMIQERIGRDDIGVADVELVCTLESRSCARRNARRTEGAAGR